MSRGEERRPGALPTGEYITLQEFADLLRIGRGTAWSLVMEKAEIPHLRFGDRVVRLSGEARGTGRSTAGLSRASR